MYQMFILLLLNFYGVKWSAEQIKECAEMLYDDFYFLTLAELKHFGLCCKSGKYAWQNFNPSFLNPVTLVDWMGQYAEESLKIREQNAQIQAGDERYNERWGSHDERKGQQQIDDAMKGQMEIIKSNLKNKDNGNES